MDLTNERRRERRLPLSGFVEISYKEPDGRSVIITGLVEDVSASGACIQTDREVPVAMEVTLSNSKRTGQVSAVVRNIRHAGTGGYFVGLEFSGDFKWKRS